MFKIVTEIIAKVKAKRQSHEDIKDSRKEAPVFKDSEEGFWVLKINMCMFCDVKYKIERIELHVVAMQGLCFFC